MVTSGIGAVETRWQRKDGSIIHILLSSSALDSVDLSRGVTFVALDITDAKRAEAEKQKTEAHLRHVQKMEALGTLAGGVAHDFNNILGIIIGYSEIASWRNEAQGGIKKDLDQVLKAAHRAKDLVQQILAFSRASEQEKKPVEISIIAKEALKMLRASLPATIEIRSRFANGAAIMGSPTEIHQVLMNLCTNSAHAMREHGGVLEVAVAGVQLDTDATPLGLQPGRYVELAVRDTGSGMDQATMERIFDPFFTTKGPGEGTGLGLAVVHGIVERHNGVVRVESEPGKGSCFRVLLPAIDKREAPKETPSMAALPRGRERILVVDDEPMLAEVIQEILAGLGYRVDVETSPVEALQVLQKQAAEDAFDLVITDMTMPHLTGADLLRELRSRRLNVPVILCTGFSDQVDAERAAELGMQGFLMKPVVARMLAELVREVLDKSRPKNA
jgi:signal transduction histidine kinase/ActR/RegA family two-component response regulator